MIKQTNVRIPEEFIKEKLELRVTWSYIVMRGIQSIRQENKKRDLK